MMSFICFLQGRTWESQKSEDQTPDLFRIRWELVLYNLEERPLHSTRTVQLERFENDIRPDTRSDFDPLLRRLMAGVVLVLAFIALFFVPGPMKKLQDHIALLGDDWGEGGKGWKRER